MGDSINPALFNPDFSGHANAGMIKGQAMSDLGSQVGDLIKERKQYKRNIEQNEKFIEQAYKMFEGTEMATPIKGMMDKYMSDETTDRERFAMGQTMRETIGLGMGVQDMKMKRAAMMGSGGVKPPTTKTFKDPSGNDRTVEWDPTTGVWKELSIDPSLISPPASSAPQQEAGLDGSFWYGQDIPTASGGVAVDGGPGVLPMRQDVAPAIPTDEQALAGNILANLGGQPPAPAPQQAAGGAWGLAKPEQGDQYEQFVNVKGQLMQRNFADNKVSQVGGGGINITVGGESGLTKDDWSDGWRERTNPETGEVERYGIPNSKAYFEIQKAQREASEGGPKDDEFKKIKEQDLAEKSANNLEREVNRGLAALDSISSTQNAEALIGRVIKGNTSPGTPEFDLQRSIKAMKSMIMLSSLKEMKAASPTGASGMGALNQSEGDALREQHGQLSLVDDPKVLRENLVDLRMRMFDTVHETPRMVDKLLADGTITPQVHKEYQVKRAILQRSLGIAPNKIPSLFNEEEDAEIDYYKNR